MKKPFRQCLILLSVTLLALALPLAPATKKKPEASAVIAGGIFTAEGFALPGVPVSIRRQGDAKPKWRTASDSRGEFVVRLPAGRATYEVATHSDERENESQTIDIYGQERVDLIFRLTRKRSGEKQ